MEHAQPVRIPLDAETSLTSLINRSSDPILSDICVHDERLSETVLDGVSFEHVIFERCRFPGCSFRKNTFTDVIFRSCDLSSCMFSGSFFRRCAIDSVRGVGANFTAARLIQTSFADSNMNYANFDSARLEKTAFLRTDLSDSYLTNCLLRCVTFDECRLNHATLFKTGLRGIDLSGNEIEGLIVSSDADELKGVVIDMFQAVEVARLLGVVVK